MGVISPNLLLTLFVAAVFVRLTLGAATTFRIVPGEGPPRRSELVSLGFWAMMINSSTVPLNPWLVVPGCVFSNDTPALLWTGGPFAYIGIRSMRAVSWRWPRSR